MEKLNAATKAADAKQSAPAERKRIPMSTPVQKLSAQEIPGYHLHWFVDTPERIGRALEGGYEFVDEREQRVTSVGLGNDSTTSGNTDMGSRVSIISGSELRADGQPGRLVLMKIKQEWYDEDQKLIEARNDSVADALMRGSLGDGENPGDRSHRYIGSQTKIPDLFNRNKPQKRLT